MSDLHRGPARDTNLLDELEALKQLLNDSGTVFLDDAPSIPVLRDVVSPGSAPLLDLEDIFDEQMGAVPAPAEPQAATAAGDDDDAALSAETATAPRWERDLLIQEVVDEFVPRIEAALRERLRRIDDETLRSWLSHD